MSDSYPRSKFMRVVWTFNGIGLAVLILVAIISEIPYKVLTSFFEEDQVERGLIVGKKANKAGELNIDLQHLIYERPSKIDSSDFYYSPVVVMDKKLPQKVLNDINSAADMSIYMIGAAVNIIFFNEDRTVVRRLLPSNGYISEHLIGGERYSPYGGKRSNFPFALYRVALSDDNGDSRINGEDNMPYYLSDLDGTNFRQITPDTLNLDSYWFSDNYNEIYFDEIIVDKNSPLVLENYYEKTRQVYYYNLLTNEFRRFDELQNEFDDIQNSFDNKIQPDL
ncbi:hypothetical protein [Gracilimonas sp.]|uniref:hypothetical protein n=1 Tax=Gracilimonas sp. TaxID=1974203 RepID=UPI003BABA88B